MEDVVSRDPNYVQTVDLCIVPLAAVCDEAGKYSHNPDDGDTTKVRASSAAIVEIAKRYLVLEDVDGPGTCVIVDVKLLDAAGPTWIRTRHTDRTRRAAHLDLQRQWQRAYFRHFPSGEAPAGVRLVVFSISTFGAFGPDALALLRTLSRRSGRTVPPSLLEEASWATPVFASFARMSLSLSMRRSLAYRLREAGVTESAARVLARQPAPVPEDPDRAFDAPESG